MVKYSAQIAAKITKRRYAKHARVRDASRWFAGNVKGRNILKGNYADVFMRGKMEYDNELSGVLFTNDKDGNDKRPDYKGKIQIKGIEYELAGWIRVGTNSGKKFLSIKASLPDDSWKKEQSVQEVQPNDSSVPF